MTTVCIAGMHRSGTSMVARLLNLCGLFLGEEFQRPAVAPQDAESLWENLQFVALNDEILARLGAGWDYPGPLVPGWEFRAEIGPLRLRAEQLIREFAGHEHWGWKDPRNSITLPFWRHLIPRLKVVVCLRNPLEVVDSLRQRNYFSAASSLSLWLAYNGQLLAAAGAGDAIITHYEAYFHDPGAELKRILEWLHMDPRQELIEECVESVSLSSRHHRATLQDLAAASPLAGVLSLYQTMCDRAGPVYESASPKKRGAAADSAGDEQDADSGNLITVLESKSAATEPTARALVQQLTEATSILAAKDQALADDARLLATKDESLVQASTLLAAKDRSLEEAAAKLTAKDESLAESTRKLAAKDESLADAARLLAAKDESLADAARMLAAKDKSLAEAAGMLAAKDESLAQAASMLASKDRSLAEAEGKLAANDAKAAELTRLLAEKDASLGEARRLLEKNALVYVFERQLRRLKKDSRQT